MRLGWFQHKSNPLRSAQAGDDVDIHPDQKDIDDGPDVEGPSYGGHLRVKHRRHVGRGGGEGGWETRR